ncbi:MAG: hypothetical protein MI924_17225 [Chloroflexales bacterium]|nr:hypothetical protein [Chloroflexales bacterium]
MPADETDSDRATAETRPDNWRASPQQLGLAGKGDNIHGEPQGDHFAITKGGLDPRFAAQQAMAMLLIPIVNEHIHDRKEVVPRYPVHGKVLHLVNGVTVDGGELFPYVN